ncbi:GAF domain-containing protein [Streptomyces sp. NPDC059627]
MTCWFRLACGARSETAHTAGEHACCRRGRRSTADDSTVLKAALHHTLQVTGAAMGNVQLVQNGMLRMEHHAGLDGRFTDCFAFVGTSTTSCAQAAEESRQVTVKDVDTCGTFDEASRRAILRTGSRACHSAPLISPRGTVIGMISSHHDQPLRDLGSDRLAALDQLGRQVGRWLIWHRNHRDHRPRRGSILLSRPGAGADSADSVDEEYGQ